MMAGNMLLLLLSTVLTGVLSWRPKDVNIISGEMVSLRCPQYKGPNQRDTKVTWTSPMTQTDLTISTSSAEQRRMGVLIHGRSLLILNASMNHQGNYSCSQGNVSSRFRFMLTVYPTETREYEDRNTYSTTCYTQESCMLHCPDVNIPDNNIPTMSSNGIIWHKKGVSLPVDGYFSSVAEKDQGVYTCTRSYLYNQQTYYMSFRMILDVHPSKIFGNSEILSPHKNDVFHVELGSTVVIECKAVIYSAFDEVFWLRGTSFVEMNNSLPVFYNYTRENNAEGMKMTASLVFKKVSEEDLLKSYTCKLETDDLSSSVTITLAEKVSSCSLPLALGIVGIMVTVFVMALVCMKFKKDISLLLQGSRCCYSSATDKKIYDVFLMPYKSATGLNDEEREMLQSALEERFGSSLCVNDQNVLPGKEAVLDCVKQSRAVVLVPTSSYPGLGSGLLEDMFASLKKQQTCLIVIQTQSKEVSGSTAVSEVLKRLGAAGHSYTWRGKCSTEPSSSFFRHLPEPQHASKIRPLTV